MFNSQFNIKTITIIWRINIQRLIRNLFVVTLRAYPEAKMFFWGSFNFYRVLATISRLLHGTAGVTSLDTSNLCQEHGATDISDARKEGHNRIAVVMVSQDPLLVNNYPGKGLMFHPLELQPRSSSLLYTVAYWKTAKDNGMLFFHSSPRGFHCLCLNGLLAGRRVITIPASFSHLMAGKLCQLQGHTFFQSIYYLQCTKLQYVGLCVNTT